MRKSAAGDTGRGNAAQAQAGLPRLTAESLSAYRKPLDRIGDWTIETDQSDLSFIRWPQPADLAVDWLPIRLDFVIDSPEPLHTIDDEMFALWESFRRRRKSLLRDLKTRIQERFRMPEWSREVALRLSAGGLRLEVWQQVIKRRGTHCLQAVMGAGDQEHVVSLLFDPARRIFPREWRLG